jgi:ApbE superfamily uncharacterized protein (UPF0280 family)
MYEPRFYRDWTQARHCFTVCQGESDLFILCDADLRAAASYELARVRHELQAYIREHPDFATALTPVSVAPNAPSSVCRMARAAEAFGVGPMAAVAGETARAVGERLAARARSVVVENGGDIYACSPEPLRLGLYAGADSPFTGVLALEVDVVSGAGICTSSGTVGHSLSQGKADALVVVADDPARADAAATAYANRIQRPSDVGPVVSEALRDRGLRSVLACCGDRIAMGGDLEIVPWGANKNTRYRPRERRRA